MAAEELSSGEFLRQLWSFVHGRTAFSRFGAFVASHSALLRRVLPDETATWLEGIDCQASNAAHLRANLGKAIASFEMDCACPRFPSSATTGRTFIPLPLLVDSAFALVEHHIETNLAIIAKDAWYARAWKPSSDGAITLLQAGCYYCCRSCNASFLIVLDETNHNYLVLSLSGRELTESTPQMLRERFAADFGLIPTRSEAKLPSGVN